MFVLLGARVKSRDSWQIVYLQSHQRSAYRMTCVGHRICRESSRRLRISYKHSTLTPEHYSS
jgi:uncharacterized protein (UPF0210 family)